MLCQSEGFTPNGDMLSLGALGNGVGMGLEILPSPPSSCVGFGNLVKIGGNLMKERVRHKRSHCETLAKFSRGSEYHFLQVTFPFPAARDQKNPNITNKIKENTGNNPQIT